MDMDEITDDLMRRNALVAFKAGTLTATHAATTKHVEPDLQRDHALQRHP